MDCDYVHLMPPSVRLQRRHEICTCVAGPASDESPNLPSKAAWVLPPTGLGQRRSCSYEYAVAAAREDTRSFAKMLLTCRSIVRSLSTSSAAMDLFVAPRATRRRTCSSRGE